MLIFLLHNTPIFSYLLNLLPESEDDENDIER
jgi:hypothetical protein